MKNKPQKAGALTLTGTGKVFRFTFRQTIMSKANIVSLIVMLLFSLFTLPLSSLANGTKRLGDTLLPQTVYVYADGGSVDVQAMGSASGLPGVVFAASDEPAESLLPSLGAREAAIDIRFHGKGTDVEAFLAAGSEIDWEDMQEVTSAVMAYLNRVRLAEAGLDEATLSSLTGLSVSVMSEEEYLSEEEADPMSSFAVQYVYAILLLMLCTISASFIIRAIVEEKSSKLIELLMVSVSPLALLVGKILAVMCYILILFAVIGCGFGISWAVSSRIFDLSAITSAIDMVLQGRSLFAMAGMVAGVALISLLLGFLLVSLLSGLAGARCSTMEDVEPANMTVVFVVLAAYLISVIVAPLSIKALDILFSLLPISSMFVAPVLFVLERISLPVLLVSWVIQCLSIWLLARVAAALYRELLLSRGGRIKFSRMLAMLRGREETGKKQEVRA